VGVSFHPCNTWVIFIACKGEAFHGVLFDKFLRDENGATAIEYGLIAAGISVADHRHRDCLCGKLVTTFGKVSTALTSPVSHWLTERRPSSVGGLFHLAASADQQEWPNPPA